MTPKTTPIARPVAHREGVWRQASKMRARSTRLAASVRERETRVKSASSCPENANSITRRGAIGAPEEASLFNDGGEHVRQERDYVCRKSLAHRFVDLASPGIDAAVEVDCVVKAGVSEKVDDHLTTSAMVANDYQ